MRRLLASLSAFLALASPAFADMKAFNAAVRAGDYKAAAAEAKATWPTWNKSDPDTATVAREFGFAALVAGDNEQARQFGRFLMEQGASLPKPDDQPLTSAVLFRVADFKLGKGDGQRNALRSALVARNEAPGLDMTSILSWEALYVADWAQADWDNASTDAAAAAVFYGREPKSLLPRQRSAQIYAAAASFVGSRSRITAGRNDLYDKMADVHDAIVADLEAATTQPGRAQLWPLKWRSEAWTLAIESFLKSSYEQVGSNISTKLDARALKQPTFAEVAEDAPNAGVRLCSGRFEGKPLVYPDSKAFRGLVGSVIARMETAPDGKVTNVQVVGAVPSEVFADTVVRSLSSWTFKPAKDENTGNCRMNSKNRYYKVIFAIG